VLKLVWSSNRWLSHHWEDNIAVHFDKWVKSNQQTSNAFSAPYASYWHDILQLLTYKKWMQTKWEQLLVTRSQGRLVSVVTQVWAEQSRVGVLVGANDYSPLQNLSTGSGAHPASSGCGTRGVNHPGCKVNLSYLLLRLRMSRGYTSTPPIYFHDVNRKNFTWLHCNHKEPWRRQEFHVYI
jgi:hypothetical protein